MVLSPFFRVVAFTSILSAITTGLLLFLPEVPASDFSAQLALHNNHLYLAKKWILLFHPMFAFISMLGITIHLVKTKLHCVIPASFFALVWAITEMAQQAYTIVALNNHWRPNYLAETSDVKKQVIFVQLESYYPVWDSMYFLIIICFGIASLLFGIALIAKNRLSNVLAMGSILIGLFSILNFTSDYLRITQLLPMVNFWYEWIYGIVQPAWRILLAIWFWKLSIKYHQGSPRS